MWLFFLFVMQLFFWKLHELVKFFKTLSTKDILYLMTFYRICTHVWLMWMEEDFDWMCVVMTSHKPTEKLWSLKKKRKFPWISQSWLDYVFVSAFAKSLRNPGRTDNLFMKTEVNLHKHTNFSSTHHFFLHHMTVNLSRCDSKLGEFTGTLNKWRIFVFSYISMSKNDLVLVYKSDLPRIAIFALLVN